ncbi:HlyD family efflux transporter periplasmic adaptor subunit [Couchioplanes azureus]|uniref:HlyD family efflux transporter periplasmic adaptor subunit n=1 Tax=Couchioplanes caeruleus TaxID=56438 RepID=UPI00166F8789|nr:HlyD family efflux transporter periplasmic adaptor subunit [Couchioplanes caeruleus]GGQ73566.1 hypothetical protein GCM10010166_49560 [Couchioplanes caeruleus subsp. azureus]
MTTVVEHDRLPDSPEAGPDRTVPQAPDGGARGTSRSRMPVVRTCVVTALLVAGAAAGGTYVANHRLATGAVVTLDDATLTADALPVGATGSGVVTEILVTEQTRVAAGQELARVRLADKPPTGDRPAVEVLRAPTPGTVSDIDVAAGGVVGAGEPVITLYDHTRLSFHARAGVEQLRELRLGMAAQISGPGLARPVPAVVDHVEARVGPDPLSEAPLSEDQREAHDQLTVVLVPRTDAVDRVGTLVPGLRFTAGIDTDTAVGRTPAVNGAG